MAWSLKPAWRRFEKPLVVATAAAIVALSILPPLFAVACEFMAARGVLRVLVGGRLWWLFLRSIALGTGVTGLALAAGVPLGILFAGAEFPFRRALFAAHSSVMFLPPLLPALGWFHVLGRGGLLDGDLSSHLLFSELGVVLVLAGCFTPVVTALTALGVGGVDASLEEAARVVAGPWRTAALVLVPCASPAIALASIVVFSLTFSELGVPMFLRVNVYPAVVFSRLGGMDFAPGEAAAFALPLIFVALGLLWLERRFAGRRAFAVLGIQRERRRPLFLGQPWILAVAVLAAAVSVAPLMALSLHAMIGDGLPQLAQWLGDAPWNSVRATTLASVVMTALALVLGHALARGDRAASWLDAVAALAFVLPAPILGVGMISAWNHSATSWVYGGFAVLVVGYITRYCAVTTRTFAAAVAQVPVSLEDAARTVGAGYFRRLLLVGQVTRHGLAGAFFLGLVLSLRDLETAAFFYPPGGEPLTVRIFTLEANGPPTVVSALSILHIIITFGAIGLGWLTIRPRRST